MGLKLTWNNDTLDADISLAANGDLTLEEGLETMAIVCLFTDRRANDDDVLPDYNSPEDPGSGDKRGWLGDHYARPIVEAMLADATKGVLTLPPVSRLGSRLWLLERAKATSGTLNRAIFYATEGLQPFIDYKIASAVEVQARYLNRYAMLIHPRVLQGNSALLDRQYAYAWAAMAGNAAAPSPSAIPPRLVPPPPGPVNPWI